MKSLSENVIWASNKIWAFQDCNYKIFLKNSFCDCSFRISWWMREKSSREILNFSSFMSNWNKRILFREWVWKKLLVMEKLLWSLLSVFNRNLKALGIFETFTNNFYCWVANPFLKAYIESLVAWNHAETVCGIGTNVTSMAARP